jgi:radical SAM protein
MNPEPRGFDFAEKPYVVIWEMTQACDLASQHCRASAQPWRHPSELTTAEARHLIRDIAELDVPVFVLSGGDPLKRPDLFEVVEFAVDMGVRVSLTPSATPLLTPETICHLKQSGLSRMALSLDASTPEIHDRFRRVSGSFERTLQAIRAGSHCGLELQVNSSLTPSNIADLEAIADLISQFPVVLWSVFFIVPVGRATSDQVLTTAQFEDAFRRLYEISQHVPFEVKTTEAQHYRRYVLQRRVQQRKLNNQRAVLDDVVSRARRGLNDGKGFIFISHTGQVFPSGFLPLNAGNIREQSLGEIYRNSPLLKQLRDTSRLGGKCGLCEFREICGGSRARAFALTGDPFAEEPCCAYEPRAVDRQASGHLG